MPLVNKGHTTRFKFVGRKRLLHARPLVLIAEDDAGARRLFRAYLRTVGCRVVTASDGELAIAKAYRHRPDVIVMDLRMPKLDGWAAARLLKERAATSRIPIIALSGAVQSRDGARAAGCDAFVAKPCQPELLWCEIRVVLHAAGVMWGEMVPLRKTES